MPVGLERLSKVWRDYRNSPRWRTAMISDERLYHARFHGPSGLGLAFRLKILELCSGETQAALARAIEDVEDGSEAHARAITKLQHSVQLKYRPKIDEMMVRKLVRHFQTTRNRTITVDDFLFRKCSGPDAVEEFSAWLMGTSRKKYFYPNLLGDSLSNEYYLEERPNPRAELDGRRQLLRNIDDFLELRKDGSPQIILSIEGEGMAEGLRALAKTICYARRADPRHVVYLPVSHYPTGADAPRDKGSRICFATLVGNLVAFLATGNTNDAKPKGSVQELRADVEFIRRRMAEEPCILVFDGWQGGDDAVRRLQGALLDDGLVQLLEEIIHPWVGRDAAAMDPTCFYDNRILVLAERPLNELKTYQWHTPEKLPPPPKYAMRKILEQHRFEKIDEIDRLCARPEFRCDGLQAIIADLLWLGADVPINRLHDGAAAIREWITLLAQTRPFDLMVLRYVALSSDGIRVSTLLKLLRDWQVMTPARLPEAPGWWNGVPPDCVGALDDVALLERYLSGLETRKLLVVRSDDPIRALDEDSAEAGQDPLLNGSFEVVVPTTVALKAYEGELTFDPRVQVIGFPTVMLRSRILDDLFDRCAAQGDAGHATRRLAARMHRQIAEAALAQYTIISRHAELTDRHDVRHYRRLLQAIFHGFLGLVDGPNAMDDALRLRSYYAIPADASNAYDRLYNVYYRGWLESPPHWELARLFGREDLKIDILLTAMNADQPNGSWSSLHGLGHGLAPRVSAFLRTRNDAGSSLDADRRRTNFLVQLDQFASLARAAYHTADYPLCDQATARCREILDEWKTAEGCEAPFAARTSVAKIAIDAMIAKAKIAEREHIRKEIRASLALLGFSLELLGDLEVIVNGIGVQTNDNLWDADRSLTVLAERAAKNRKPEELAAWSDLLCRLGEIDMTTKGPGEKLERGEASAHPFATMFVAERLRRIAFERAPLQRSFYVNGHSTRVFVRATLQLIQAWDGRISSDDLRGIPTRRFLEGQARRNIDMLTRYLSPLPTERASLLILESAFARGAQQNKKDERAIKLAEYCLHEADRMMAATVNRPRVRLRFLHERCKVLLHRVAAVDTKDRGRDQHANLINAARLELGRLEHLARAFEGFWHHEAARLRKRFRYLMLPKSTSRSRL